MIDIATQRLADGKVEDVAYFEPFYLKDFVAKKSVVHGLRD
jgi:tRNA threonylcarbamoyladenosine biosynthesis protein TsaB